MPLASFEPVAIGFCVFLAGFLAGCLASFLLTEPSDDASSDGPYGDEPFIAADDLKLFHTKGIADEPA